ncbi:MAG: o-succinylbenzoate synthase [candidate division Zixibacteria bacterium]|nr:o-succinylbenzoate synthase [candidate division Zixibacteria bacterium]
MRIEDLSIFTYELPFRRTMLFDGNELESRKGLLIRLTTETSISVWGEIAPLPGFSSESLNDATQQLRMLKTNLNGVDIPDADKLLPISGAFDAWLRPFKLAPSVRFGVETAVLRLIAKQKQTSLRTLLSPKASDVVAVCALLAGTDEQVLDKAKKIRANGFKAAKLKVGRQSIERDIALTHAVRKKIGKHIGLRLDANRRWDIEQAIAFMRSVKDCDIEYIEEPVRDYLDILRLCNMARSPIPIALDESLKILSPSALTPIHGIVSVILKPTLLGLERTIQFAMQADELGMKATVSSSFESGLGVVALAEIGAGLNRNRDIALGLDTTNSFTSDILSTPLNIKKGQIDLTIKPAIDPEPRLDILDEVNDA